MDSDRFHQHFSNIPLFPTVACTCINRSSATSAQRLRAQKRAQLTRLVEALARENAESESDAETASDSEVDEDVAARAAADTSAKIDRLLDLGKREPFFSNFLSGLSSLATNTAGAFLGKFIYIN